MIKPSPLPRRKGRGEFFYLEMDPGGGFIRLEGKISK